MAGRFSIEAMFKAFDAFSAPVARIQRRFDAMTRNVTRSVAQLNRGIDSIAGGVKTVALASAAAGIAAGGALVALGKTGADFEQAMADVGAVSLLTSDQMAALQKKALELGASTKFSATEVAKGMEEMGRAGFDTEQILSGIGGMLNAAAAEGGDLAEITTTVSKVMKGMGLSMSETNRVADVLALASAKTNSSIMSLGESMANASATARQFRVPLEDTVSAIALLQDVGLDASEAGTAMATMLTKLAAPSAKAASEMAAMGIEFQDAKGNMLPLMEVFGQFAKAATKSGGNMKTAAFFAELVGLRGQKAAINMMELFKSGKVGTLTEDLRNAAGTADQMAKRRMNTFEGDIEQLGGAIETVRIKLFQLQSGPLRDVVQGMGDWIEKNGELIVSGVAEFIADIKGALPTIGEWLERVGRAAVPVLGVALAIKAVAAAQALWNLALAANPLTLWIVGITAAVALIAAFWPEISTFFKRLWKGATDLASRIGGAISGFFSAAWEKIKGFFVGAAEFLVGLIVLAFEPLMPVIQPVFDALANAAAWVMEHWEPIKAFFADLWEGVKAAFSAAWTAIVNAAVAVYDKFRQIWAPIGEFFSGIWTGIRDTFNSIIGAILGRIEKVVKFVQGVGAKALGLEPPAPGDTAATSSPAEVGANGSPALPVNTPTDSLRREIRETRSTTQHEIRVSAGKGATAEVVKTGGNGLTLQPSGSF